MAAVIKTSCLLVLFATQILDVGSAPTKLTTEYVSENLDFSKTYLQFFKIKDLIEKINIKKFRALHENQNNEIEGPAVTETEATNQDAAPSTEDNLQEIDLTEEAINNDEVSVNVEALDTYKTASEEITDIPTVITVTTEKVTAAPTAAPTDTPTAAPTVAPTAAPTDTPTAAPTEAPTEVPTVAPAQAPTTVVVEKDSETNDNDLLNEIDTGDGGDKFFISKESVESAKKYGYKILLKKIDGKEVPVGKIKFSFPTLVEINPVEDAITEEVIADEVIVEVTAEAVVVEEVPIEIVTKTDIELKSGEEAEASVSTVAAVQVDVTGESSTAEIETVAETTTALAVTFVPPPLESVIPTVDALDEYSISEGVKQITEDTEVAIKEIKNQNSAETVVFDQCVAPFADVEDMLMGLAKIIKKQTPMISEILSVGKSLKDETSPEILSRSGAKLLMLLEPFLESLVPTQLSGCAGESSNAMLISLSGMASQLDTIASNEINQDRANSLHKSATSLQLAAWVMAQLQSSVHSFYSQEGICGDEDSSTTEILGSLSKAITGYIPIVTMLGNEESVDELKETIEALNKAQTDIAELEAKSGTGLPGVECGASFSEMAEALENLADFVAALDSNSV